MTDVLVSLTNTLVLGVEKEMTILVCSPWVVPPNHKDSEEDVNAICALETDKEDWCQSIIEYLKHGKLPSDLRHKIEIWWRAPSFLYYNRMLYRRSFLALWLQCLDMEEAKQAMEGHSGVCGADQSGPKLHDRIKRIRYYWHTMVQDYIDYANRCDGCQFHANLIHQPSEPLLPTVASWPLEAWGFDVIGPITPKSFVGDSDILAATDYFSKWAEAIPLREAKKDNFIDFIRMHIIYRYGVPRYFITDNGKPFLMTSLRRSSSFPSTSLLCTMLLQTAWRNPSQNTL